MIRPVAVAKPPKGTASALLYTMPGSTEGYLNAFDISLKMDTAVLNERLIFIIYSDSSGHVAHTEFLDEFSPPPANRNATYVRGPVEDDIVDDPTDATLRWAIGSLGEMKMDEGWTISVNVLGFAANDQLSNIICTMEIEDVTPLPDVIPVLTPLAAQDQLSNVA